ncbi:MAG: flagellar biosynthesis protein FliQ [Rhodothermales bacterium]|nr:flagellar biosynthesis protein FliQ [Rhodothermales bacterium]
MNADVALFWVQEAMSTAFMVAAPLLGAALAVGVMVSLFQAVTSMQEMTLSYIPKILIVAAALLLLAPWMLQHLTDFTTHVFTAIPSVSR